jgi:hypothetical protein
MYNDVPFRKTLLNINACCSKEQNHHFCNCQRRTSFSLAKHIFFTFYFRTLELHVLKEIPSAFEAGGRKKWV